MIHHHFDYNEKQRLRDFVSGLVAGVISVTVCNPLDIARTRLNLMVNKNIFRVLQVTQISTMD